MHGQKNIKLFNQTIQHTQVLKISLLDEVDSTLVSVSMWKMLMKPVFIPNILRFKGGERHIMYSGTHENSLFKLPNLITEQTGTVALR